MKQHHKVSSHYVINQNNARSNFKYAGYWFIQASSNTKVYVIGTFVAKMCLANPRREYASSVKVTTHLVKHLKHLKHTSYQTSLLVVGTQSNQLRKTRKTQRHQVRCLTWQLKKGHRCGWQYFLSQKWAPIWLNRSSVMLSNHNMAGQSMIFPPRIHECMRTSLYVRQKTRRICHTKT